MLKLDAIPFFDNHTHCISADNTPIDALDLALSFCHGWGPILPADMPLGVSAERPCCNEEYARHAMNTGVFKTLICQLAQYYGCEAEAETVAVERNRRTTHDGKSYVKALYEDSGVIAEVVDEGMPMNDPSLAGFPVKVLRLFQMDPAIRRQLSVSSCYEELCAWFEATVREKKRERYIGLKSHVLELLDEVPHDVSPDEGALYFKRAKAGERQAFGRVYLSLFCRALVLSQELNFSIHIHTGTTGNTGSDVHADKDQKGEMQIFSNDSYLLCPLLRDKRYMAARLVLLHGNYPDIRRAALMTHAFPNVYMDLSWVLPWTALGFERNLSEALEIAMHDKLMLGTGQHNFPEMSWLAARLARKALEHVLSGYVAQGLMSEKQAMETASDVMYRNAQRLYGCTFDKEDVS